ncbi:MAG: hypothetical protein GY779_04950, partial [Gammaproteobacteria bacterium]|nr:hypothetical protein [Gammaproteobacteria bacterium]
MVTVGDSYNITYTLFDTDDVVTVDFYYDTDNTGFDGTLISTGSSEGTGVTSAWDTTGMLPGTYYVYGKTNDGTNPEVKTYSSGMLTISSSGGNFVVLLSDADSYMRGGTSSGTNYGAGDNVALKQA